MGEETDGNWQNKKVQFIISHVLYSRKQVNVISLVLKLRQTFTAIW